jgi:XTP/dITP diphosphohydrolase
MKQLLIATHNQGKVAEFREMLPDFEIKSAADFDLPEPEETESTFEGNAILKARAAIEETGLPCLADDSGLTIDALEGAPGIHSARWAEVDGQRDFSVAMQKVNEKLGGIKGDETAHFVAVLALLKPDGAVEIFEGRSSGHLCWPPRGEKGFGYDPIFIPEGYDVTFAEMEPSQKHAMSHRAKAVEKFAAYLKENG